MKNIFLFLGIVLFLSACHDENEDNTPTCQSLTTVAEWPVIDFKARYTIQVPKEFIGYGYSHGWEGSMFLKKSPDGKITLNSYYGTSTFKYEFGNALPDTIPAQDQVKNRKGQTITLDHRDSFCQNDEIVGYLYYSRDEISNGQLYWKVNDMYLASLVLEFPLKELGTIRKIISTIKIKPTDY